MKTANQVVNPAFVKNVVYAFVGPAGTGKSQRAQFVADYLNAEYIIDDGLVLRRTAIVAGKSAKTERNQIRAIRRALFEYDDHRKAVVDFFITASPCSVMIIATSDVMATRIISKLGFPTPRRTIWIDEVATPEEIARARKERHSKGQHVIPVSHVLVRKNFAGKMVGRLRVLWKTKSPYEGEKTIVRPPFSFYGEVHIEPEAIEQMLTRIVTNIAQVSAVVSSKVDSTETDALQISLEVKLTTGSKSLLEVCRQVKQRVIRSVSYFTGLDILNVDVNVVGLDL